MAKKPGTTRNKSAMKQARQAEKRRVRNQNMKSTVKTATKKVDAGIAAGDAPDTKEKLRLAIKTIDMAASKGVLHRNTASRKISRLTKRVNKELSPATP